jgi:hypothetical protein
MCFDQMPVETELLSIIDAADPVIDIVFVHGLDGDSDDVPPRLSAAPRAACDADFDDSND